MKPLNIQELDLICQEWGRLKLTQLQEVRFFGDCLELGFWVDHQRSWWHLSLKATCPVFLPVSGPKLSKKSQMKPIYLFLKAHAVGKQVKSLERNPKLGRVLKMILQQGSSQEALQHSSSAMDSLCEIEMRLFPHGQNLMVRSGGKQVSLKPVKEMEFLGESSKEEAERVIRSLEQLQREFENREVGSPQSVFSEKLWKRQLAKLEKSIERASQDLEKKRSLQWKKAGEELVQTQSLRLEEPWASYIDLEESLSWNIENCFSKEKSNQRKIEGGESRLADLKVQLEVLKEQGPSTAPPKTSLPGPFQKGKTSKKQAIKTRKRSLPGGLEAWVGRNAKENVKLLRQAKPWDIWVHLVDHPSSHGVIRRSKGVSVPSSVLIDVGKWVVQTTFGDKFKKYQGERFEILYTECRYVSPIKGDRLGRVVYRNEKVIGFKF